ncbi:MAG: gliding motility-associated C-terminal domain-containing protein [Bacteroidia bacterium]
MYGFDINTCTDSIKMVVYPSSISGYDTTICSSHPTMMVVSPPLPPGTTWSGPGIVTPSLGIFNPGAVLAGNAYTLNYTNKAGCGGSVVIDVYQFVPAGIANLNNVYCFRNNDYVFTTTPPNGTLTTTPVIPSNTINPSIIGQGTYTINYQFGYGACNTSTTRVITIHPELVTTKSITKDTVCIGEASLLSINASGGLPTVGQYTYTWSNGLINLSSHNVLPNTTTAYTVATDDGCSDPAIDTLLVNVAPQFYPSFATTSIQCYGEPGTATVNITPGGSTFSYTWNTSPVQSTSVVTGTAGKNYNVKIRNLTTGCAKDTFVRIPGYNAIQALFNPNPNLPCIPFDQSIVTFLDLSNGSLNGTWYVDGVSKPYTPGQSMNHEFMNPGTYPVRLLVTNDGNCPSEYSMDICIEESTEIFIPDIFSPNGDGANDVFYVRGNGIKEMNFYIYDRWGNKVFESHDANDGWKGDYKGKNAESGVYAYYLDATMFNDKKITKKGDLTLIR